ncbi:hypothetical protein GK047_20500 [Paenibacillus sp. SYP-B3998]|uniref:Nucleotidase n=1 Tax=Paenibacillus sp. SYP-B3998 TaxID=2678564 RepID=A0A6G4A3I4_9BACL|nr:hypothetical protein [Paenibacillus sp. SYP-B3998]NEW08381.1 hypothetical protein [Paenibacillus sp. SYP-B3998]
MKFGFDIDDTLINLREHAFHIYNKKLSQNVGLDIFNALTTLEIHEAFGLSKEEGGKMWASHRDEIYYTACPLFPNALETLHDLVNNGHEVFYITARPPGHCERTLNWLIEHGFPVAKGHFYCGMDDKDKVHIIQELQLDYYFDDKPAVLETLSDLALNVYVRDRSYNQHLDIPRITSWEELKEAINL